MTAQQSNRAADGGPVTETEKYSAPALSKGLDILELLSTQAAGLKKAEVAHALDRSVSEIYRMLVVLQQRGYVFLDQESERYTLTMRMFELAHRFPPTKRLNAVAGEIMEDTAQILNQSIHLAILYENNILVIAQVDPPGNNINSVRLGARVPLAFTASGACLTYQFSKEKRAEMCALSENVTNETIRLFEQSVEQVTTSGVCECPSAIIAGIHNISVPIISYSGTVVASLTVPHVQRLVSVNDPDIEESKRVLLRAGQRISDRIGAGAATDAPLG